MRAVADDTQPEPNGDGQGGGGGGGTPKRTLPRAQQGGKAHCVSNHETLRHVIDYEPAGLSFDPRTFKELCDFGKAETNAEKVRSEGSCSTRQSRTAPL